MSKQEDLKQTKHEDMSSNRIDELKQRIKELEEKKEALDIENKFLKELRKLREAEERQHKNK